MKSAKTLFTKFVIFVLILALSVPLAAFTADGITAAGIYDLLKINCGYAISGDKLLGVGEKTTVTEFLSAFDSSDISVQNTGNFIGTGSKVKLTLNGAVTDELTLIVKGDTNGDGLVSSMDYLKIKRAVLGTFTLTDVYLLAAKVSDGTVLSAKDYLCIKRYCLGTYNIYNGGTMNYNGKKVAYVPIDDRPVNVDRVKYLAASAGYELLMPAADYYSTKLDGNGTNSNGTKYGNREELVKWLQSVDAECDYFVISLDQMLSGGLVNSRVQKNTDLTYEYEIMNFLLELNKNNHVYFFDTVMRLASTVNYNGYDNDEYGILRSYGQVARATLTGANLTIENIIAGYKYNTSGQIIPCTLPDAEIDAYLAARARKLKLIDYMLTTGGDAINYCYIGVDDSSPSTTIQTNEIAYIRSKLQNNGILYAGCDELGLVALTRLTSDLYRTHLNTAVTYFGGSENYAADGYDIGTLKSTVEDHLTSVNAVVTTPDKASLEILILTKPNSNSLTYYCNQLLDRLEANIEKHIPTVVIDASSQNGTLQPLMASRQVPLSTLLGYSNWNTVSNAVGIAVSQGVSRMIYLKNSMTVTVESNMGFLRSMTFAYIKDISYKTNNVVSKSTLLSLINSSGIITALNNYKTESVGTVSVSAYRYPWNRGFEATFDIYIK